MPAYAAQQGQTSTRSEGDPSATRSSISVNSYFKIFIEILHESMTSFCLENILSLQKIREIFNQFTFNHDFLKLI